MLFFSSTSSPSSNLRSYAANAVLADMNKSSTPARGRTPSMPDPGHKSYMNLLHVKAEDWRVLHHLMKLDRPHLVRAFAQFWKTLPAKAANSDSEMLDNVVFRVEATGFNIGPLLISPPNTVSKVVEWCEHTALQTAQSILHAAFPTTAHWCMFSDEDYHKDKLDFSIMKRLSWMNVDCENTPASYRSNLTPMLVFVQPPWILSPKDLQGVLSRENLKALRCEVGETGRRLRSSERVWAKIYDACFTAKCHWFVLTSYGQWAFGVFSPSWQTVFVFPAVPYDTRGPTVTQLLCFWMMSSIGGEGGFQVPQTPNEEIFQPTETVPREIPAEEMKRVVYYCASRIDSVSEYEGQDDEPISIHGSEWQKLEDQSEGRGKRSRNDRPELKGIPFLHPTERVQEWRSHPFIPKYAPRPSFFYKHIPQEKEEDRDSVVQGSGSTWSECGAWPDPDPVGGFLYMNPEENVGAMSRGEIGADQAEINGWYAGYEEPQKLRTRETGTEPMYNTLHPIPRPAPA